MARENQDVVRGRSKEVQKGQGSRRPVSKATEDSTRSAPFSNVATIEKGKDKIEDLESRNDVR